MLRIAIQHTLGAQNLTNIGQLKLINQMLDRGRCAVMFMDLHTPVQKQLFYTQHQIEIDALVDEDEELYILLHNKSIDSEIHDRIRLALEKMLMLIEKDLVNGTSRIQ